MHVSCPCPWYGGGKGGWSNAVMGSHSNEQDCCHTHQRSVQFFFLVKKAGFNPR